MYSFSLSGVSRLTEVIPFQRIAQTSHLSVLSQGVPLNQAHHNRQSYSIFTVMREAYKGQFFFQVLEFVQMFC